MRRKSFMIIGFISVIVIAASIFIVNQLYSVKDLKQELSDIPSRSKTPNTQQNNKVAKKPLDGGSPHQYGEGDSHDIIHKVLTDKNTNNPNNVNKKRKGGDIGSTKPILTEVKMSHNGLGPFPEIPKGYPIEHPFDDKMDIDYELIARVRINFFRDYGIFAESIGMDGTTGLVQILDENQIYIDWSSTVDDEGQSINYVSSLTALPNIVAKIHENARNRNPTFREGDLILETDIPKDILILSGNDGIDPYEYLDLPRY